jgi:predicted membrane protein
MGYLRNHLATVVVACFAVFLSAMYFYMPAALNQLLLVSMIVTWFLVVICWLAQKSADWTTKHGGHGHEHPHEHPHTHEHTHSHEEKKSSTRITNVSAEELNRFRESFTAELNEVKDEVKLKDNEIARMRQEIANLETLVQIESLKAELANLKAAAAKKR